MSSTEPTRPDDLEKVVGDETEAAAVREADLRNGEPEATRDGARPPRPVSGTDTPTGTDPAATYDHPGYEDKSLGQAVQQDRELADRLLDEAGGDQEAAARQFEEQSAGRTTRDRQRRGGTGQE
jgi:hypothetical protein